MPLKTIVTMPGDGIGRVVLEETLRVLDAAGFRSEYIEADIGWEFCAGTSAGAFGRDCDSTPPSSTETLMPRSVSRNAPAVARPSESLQSM